MMTKNMTRTTFFATVFAALLFSFSTSVHAQGFSTGPRSEPNRTKAPAIGMPQKQTTSSLHHSTKPNQPPKLRHHTSKPAPIHHQTASHHAKPGPKPAVCHDHHYSPQPQVVVIGQHPKKPTLLEKIVNVFR